MKSIGNCLKSKDFFGLANITTKDISGSFSRYKLPEDNFRGKYLPLLKKRNSLANEEATKDVVFGTVRLDGENTPSFHGQFEPSSDKPLFDTVEIKQRYIKELEEQAHKGPEPEEKEAITGPYPDGPKIADVKPERSLMDVLKEFKNDPKTEPLGKYDNKAPLFFHFKNPIVEESEFKLSGHQLDASEIDRSILDVSKKQKESKLSLVYDLEKDKPPLFEPGIASDELTEINIKTVVEPKFDGSLNEKYDVTDEEPIRAADYLRDVRKQRIEPTAKGLKHRIENDNPYAFRLKVKLDSQGFNDYSEQVPDWHKLRHVELLNHLKRSIVFHNYDILAVNKPYGIASHNEYTKKGAKEMLDMNQLMSEIAAQMKIEKLYLAHRLDKTTTGVLLFATSQERARNLNKLFKSDQITKTYWCITSGVPLPETAIIDIPVGIHSLAGRKRSCLAPERVPGEFQLSKKYVESRRAITEYKVLNVNENFSAALVEVKPRTGVKHQIRCHLGFGLNKPILGDHKYSHIDKYAPQNLASPLLKLLHLRQSKVRTLPVHLHAKKIVIPGAKANGETLFIEAPIPHHFSANLKSLKLANLAD